MSKNIEEIISQQLFYDWSKTFSCHFALKCFLCIIAEMELKPKAGTAQSVQYLACGMTSWRITVWFSTARSNFFSYKIFRPHLRPSQSSVQCVTQTLSQVKRRPGHEARHSLPNCPKVKNECSYTFTLVRARMAQHRDNLYFYVFKSC